MTRAEFLHRAALTLGFESKSLRHLQAYADEVHKIAPFDDVDPKERLANALDDLSSCVRSRDYEKPFFRISKIDDE